MDQCTHEVRLQYWKNIISLCHERPSGQTAKQWLKENGICEQTYYSWQRKIRQESYDSMQDTSKEVLSSLEENEISFSDISYPISNVPAEVDPADCNDRSDAESVEAIRPVAVIKNGSCIGTVSAEDEEKQDNFERNFLDLIKEIGYYR